MEEAKHKPKKNFKKTIISLVILVVALAVAAGGFSYYAYTQVRASGNEQIIYVDYAEKPTKVDYVIVPGSGTVSRLPSEISKAHLKRAIQLYAMDLTDKILLSGTKTEVTAMEKYLMFFDIPESCIWIDNEGIDTYNTILRASMFFPNEKMYFCTLPQYADRAGFIIKNLDIDGKVVNSNSIIYQRSLKSYLREYFASTKAYIEAKIIQPAPQTDLTQAHIINCENTEITNTSVKTYGPKILLDEIYSATETVPDKSSAKTETEPESYNTKAAVDYAKKYVYERNGNYPIFQNNCTNYVSQCLIAGGLNMSETQFPNDHKPITYDDNESAWYCGSSFSIKERPPLFTISTSFARTDSFVKYWVDAKKKQMLEFPNTFEGRKKMRLLSEPGDVFLLYDKEGNISHMGILTSVTNDDAAYCGNTADRMEFSTSGINNTVYPRFGIIRF